MTHDEAVHALATMLKDLAEGKTTHANMKLRKSLDGQVQAKIVTKKTGGGVL